jgi:hypothetical protein
VLHLIQDQVLHVKDASSDTDVDNGDGSCDHGDGSCDGGDGSCDCGDGSCDGGGGGDADGDGGATAALLADIAASSAAEVAFSASYAARTGRPWLHHFSLLSGPRLPPRLHMWPAQRLGQTHRVISSEGYW